MASFEQQLKQRLANASKPAPATDGDWERLQAALAAAEPKKKRTAWLLWGTTAVGVFSIGFVVFSLVMEEGSGKHVVGAGFTPAKKEAGSWQSNQSPPVMADGNKNRSKKIEVGAGLVPAQKKAGTEKSNQLPSNKAGLNTALAEGLKDINTQLPSEPSSKAEGTESAGENILDESKAGEIPKLEPPATPKNLPPPPQIKLPKKTSLPIVAGIETSVLGSKQSIKGSNATFAQIRKAGDKRTLGYSNQLTVELGSNPDSYRDYKITTGFGFQQQNFNGNYVYPYKWVDSFPVYVGGVIVGWGKNPPRDTTLNYTLSSNMKTLIIPVKIRFNQKLGSNWGALVDAGMQYGYVIGANGQMLSSDKNLPNFLDIQMLRKHTFTLSLGFGGYYDVNRWLRLYLQTGYGKQLTSIFKQYNTTSNTLNLTLGCQFKL
ncbi:MAG: hypothetical protein EXR21_05695 [Flavobacteriaceae bacterium]|nr:hypothetical protein [Flavobacteriaceae bacterium]